MAQASFVQTNFTGGEWSKAAQGRMDDDAYDTAMLLSLNGIPVETGAWTRRPGTALIGATRQGLDAAIREFHFVAQNSYIAEFTTGYLRFTTNGRQVLTGSAMQPTTISAANPAVVTRVAHGLATDDEIQFYWNPGEDAVNPLVGQLTGRTFLITVLTADTFSIRDSVSGAGFNGALLSGTLSTLRFRKVLAFTTPYIPQNIHSIDLVQDQNVALVLCQPVVPVAVNGRKPYAITADTAGNLTFTAADFQDGPYLDEDTTRTIIPSGNSGSITLTASAATWVATDVGRLVRLRTEAATWNAATTYAALATVKYQDAYYTAAGTPTVGVPPTQDITVWVVNPTAIQWTWGQITAYTSSTVVTFLVKGNPFPDLLAKNFRLGLYSDTTGYPSVGCYHAGRFWLAGAVPNRIDATQPQLLNGSAFSFAPTGPDGSVADNNGISIILKTTDINTVFWIKPGDRGIVVGTQGGEWLIQASALNDPITPTDIGANRVTKFKCANVQPVTAPLSTIFVQAHGRSVIEHVPDGTQGGKYGGANLALKAKHLTAGTITKLAYQQETSPVVWMTNSLGYLFSMSYKRTSPWTSQPADFYGWAQHQMNANGDASGRLVSDLASGPSPDGTIDAITMVTHDNPAGSSYRVETFDKMFEEGDSIAYARYLDHALTPSLIIVNTSGGVATGVTLYGLYYHEGQVVTVYLGSVNAGTYTVVNGAVTVPVGGLLTPALIATFAIPSATYDSGGYGASFGMSDQAATGAAATTLNVAYELMSQGNIESVSTNATRYSVNWDTKTFMSVTNPDGVRICSIADGTFIAKSTADGEFLDFCCGSDGYFYAVNTGGTWTIRDPSTGVEVATMGGSGVDANGPCVVQSPGGGPHMLLCGRRPTGITPGSVFAYNLSTRSLAYNAYAAVDEKFALHTWAWDQLGLAYVLGTHNDTGSSLTDPLGLYTVTLTSTGAPTLTKKGTLGYATIDAGWTSWGIETSFIYDATDGNLMFFCTGVGNANKYLVKVSSTNFAVLWKLSVVNFPNGSVQTYQGMDQTRIRFGQYVFLGNTTKYVVNTLTGVAVTSAIAGYSAGQDQIYNDSTGHLFVTGGSYNSATGGAPTRGGPYTAASWGSQTSFLGPIVATAPLYTFPAAVGFPFMSKGQILRRIAPAETGAQNGPAFGKTSRIHQFAMMLNPTQDLKIGTSFNELKQVEFLLPGGTPYAANVAFSGVIQDTINDNYNIDASQLCWQTNGPYPATVLAISGFVKTQDR